MNITFLAGAFQLIVAAYALRLNLLFGTRRVGWSLFLAFLLLSLLHLVQAVGVINLQAEAGLELEFLYLLVSFLLLTGLLKSVGALRHKRITRTEIERFLKTTSGY
jgi:hypothetical protein